MKTETKTEKEILEEGKKKFEYDQQKIIREIEELRNSKLDPKKLVVGNVVVDKNGKKHTITAEDILNGGEFYGLEINFTIAKKIGFKFGAKNGKQKGTFNVKSNHNYTWQFGKPLEISVGATFFDGLNMVNGKMNGVTSCRIIFLHQFQNELRYHYGVELDVEKI